MAKQGLLKFERNFGNVIFYRRCGKWFFRKHSSLSSKTVKTAQAFARTRASARRLSIASRVAASVYRQLPKAWKMYELYQKLTGLAIRLQKEGKTVTEIRPLLELQLYDWGYRKEIDYPIIKPSQKPIVIRSAKECKAVEVQQQIRKKTHPATKEVKRERLETIQLINRGVRKVIRKYSIRRIRKSEFKNDFPKPRTLNFKLYTLNLLPTFTLCKQTSFW